MKPSPPDELPPPEQLPSKPAPIRCDERLGGLLKSFRRAA